MCRNVDLNVIGVASFLMVLILFAMLRIVERCSDCFISEACYAAASWSRVVMPLSLEEYRVAQMYMVAKMQQYNTTGKEGVEVLENRPFEDLQLGKGMYTRKVYHLQSKIPGWLASFTPPNALLLEEEAWNDFPNCKAVLKCPYFPRFKLTVDTVHVADRGFSSNVHKLDDASLAIRKVEMVDIGSDATDYWSYMIGGPSVDLRTFISKKTGRGLLSAGWQVTTRLL